MKHGSGEVSLRYVNIGHRMLNGAVKSHFSVLSEILCAGTMVGVGFDQVYLRSLILELTGSDSICHPNEECA